MAPIEEHGLSLPLATDLIEGEHWSKDVMLKLEEREGYNCFYLPSFPIAAASVSEFYGCIHFSMSTTYAVARELLDNLIHMGFMNIVIIASHADPVHQIAVEKAIRRINKHYGIRAISPLGAFFSLEELGIKHLSPKMILEMAKKYPNDFHAGWIETSSMIAMNEKLVREGYREIPRTFISGREIISKKKQLAAMGEYGHLGNPAVADKVLGELLNQDIAEFIAEAVKSFVKRENYKIYMHHFLYRIPFLHLGFIRKTKWRKTGKKVSK